MFQYEFLSALKKLVINKSELAIKQRRQQKLISHKQIRNQLSLWIAPIFELRVELNDNPSLRPKLDSISDTLEYKLLTFSQDKLLTLIPTANSAMNQVNYNYQ